MTLLKEIGLNPSDYEKKIHIALVDQDLSILSKYKFDDVLQWSNKIVYSNRKCMVCMVCTLFRRLIYI